MSIERKIARRNHFAEMKVQKKKEVAEAKAHPCAEYIEDLEAEMKTLLREHPEVQAFYKEQILLIRNEYERKSNERAARVKEIVALILKKSEEAVLNVEADYRDKEIWELMKSMELERDEIKSIIKNYGEKK